MKCSNCGTENDENQNMCKICGNTLQTLKTDENTYNQQTHNYNQYTTVKSGYKIIQANFEFENIGNNDFYASVYNFNCYADNYACESFWNLDDDIFGATLSQGRKVRGNVYFEVPQNSYSITIEYELDMWSGKEVLFKVK